MHSFIERNTLKPKVGATPAPGGIKKVSQGGQYNDRPSKHRRIIFSPGHDFALALIYGPLLGAWPFPISYACVLTRRNGSSLRATRFGDSGKELAPLPLLFGWSCSTGAMSGLYNAAAKRDGTDEGGSEMENTMQEERKVPESFKTYEDGKHRRINCSSQSTAERLSCRNSLRTGMLPLSLAA